MAVLKAVSCVSLMASTTLTTPAAVRGLDKRASPRIDSAFSEQQKTQLTDGFRNAIELAVYAVMAMDYDAQRAAIFNKYFNEADRDTVRNVFLKILGDPTDYENPGTGSDKLGGITIKKDFPDDEDVLTCDDTTTAELRDYDEGSPTLVMCNGAFGHGGISLGYDNVQEINCDWIGDRLVAPPLPQDTADIEDAYGPIGTRALDKSQATEDADSFSWYANEATWAILCEKDFAEPQEGDDIDPHCGDTVCQP